MKLFSSCAALMTLLVAVPAISAQEFLPVARDGWEGFKRVEYLGGDLTLGGKKMGALVLTDSTIAFHECDNQCYDNPKKPFYKPTALLTIPYRSIVKLQNAAQTRAAGGTAKFLMGASAADHSDELVTIAYESEKSAEAPVFATQRAQSSALVAKINFRRKKLGLKVDSLDQNR